ncbi:peptide-N4-asparagine amidase [Thermogladius sp. 4427co]|uniref:peptide-N4-asparagine amidase n=1 Tax=Thermogladius sp. 4427co TaxID=3450718 RepID=UPI003F7A65ED
MGLKSAILVSIILLLTVGLETVSAAYTTSTIIFKELMVSPLSERTVQQAYVLPILPPGVAVYAGLDTRPGMSTVGFWSWQDYPGYVPSTQPIEVALFTNTPSNNLSDPNYPPIPSSKLITLPSGTFSKIILRVNVTMESAVPGRPGVNYDRALWIFVDGIPLLIGTTAQRFNYTLAVDVTHLYPILVGGSHNFTMILNNWVIPRLGLTGYFVVNASLLYYPGNPPPDVPDLVIPLWNTSGLSWITLNTRQPSFWQVSNIPGNVVQAYLYLYAEGASYDEFWWTNIPTDRLIMVYSDGRLIAVTQAFPYIYTGGILPFLWRPVPSIDTYAFHPFVIDVTPYLPYIVGTHNFTITVTNNMNYWLIGGFLALKTSSQTVTYTFLGDNPVLNRVESQSPTGSGTIYSVRTIFSNTARLNITVGGSTYTYTVTYRVYVAGTQSYNDVWWNTTLTQAWGFESYWGGSKVARYETSDIRMNYYEIVNPQGDISKATVSNPVPAQDILNVFIVHTYSVSQVSNIGGVYNSTYSKQSVSAYGGMASNLLFISPTGAIITSISKVYARTTKTEYYELKLGASTLYRFNRLTIGLTRYPPLIYAIEKDIVGIYSAR